jgi:methylamine dehydrogenase light chain
MAKTRMKGGSMPDGRQKNRSIDGVVERMTRGAASAIGRRSFLARLGGILVGSALPVLPYGRGRAAESEDNGPTTDDTDCAYWRYCALDGNLCSCCGGSATACPPGTALSPVSWVGTCENPFDGRTYLVSYNDCCGKLSCGKCDCFNNQGERPPYQAGLSNDFNWCMANDSTAYHCTVAVLVGVDDSN